MADSRGWRIERMPDAVARDRASLVPVRLGPAGAGRRAASCCWLAGRRIRSRSTRRCSSGALGDWNGVAETLVKTIPLLLAGLGVAVAFRMQLWNIGAEGQFYLGAIVATGTALYLLPDAPRLGAGAGHGRRPGCSAARCGRLIPGRAARLSRRQRDHHQR